MIDLLWMFFGISMVALSVWLIHLLKWDVPKSAAVGLLIAALIYVGFAVMQGMDGFWFGIEMGGVLIYGTLAYMGWRFSLWWVILGWAFHSVWDTVLHLYGPGHGIAPVWYAHACLWFDLALAGYLIWWQAQQKKVAA